MNVNLDSNFKGLNNVNIKDGEVDAKLGVICARALATPLERDKGMQPEAVTKRWQLACKLQLGGSVDLTPEQVTEIRSRVAEVFALEVAGPVLELLA